MFCSLESHEVGDAFRDASLPPSEVDRCLIRRFRSTQDDAYRNSLVERHTRLVWHIAWKYASYGETVEDLAQEGFIGLLRAIDLYDPSHVAKFSTYAITKIVSQINHYLRDKKDLIRQPAWVQDLARNARKKRDELQENLSREPSSEEIAASLDISTGMLKRILEAQHHCAVVSLDGLSGADANEGEGDWDSFLFQDDGLGHDPLWDERLDLEQALKRLPQWESEAIHLHFFIGMSTTEIAEAFQTSRTHVRCVLASGLRGLRAHLTGQPLRKRRKIAA
jgi:RNA polymerase sigma-B factor